FLTRFRHRRNHRLPLRNPSRHERKSDRQLMLGIRGPRPSAQLVPQQHMIVTMAYTRELGRTFWFKFDEATKYNSAFITMVGNAGGFDVQEDFADTRRNGTYPVAFRQKFVPFRNDWVRIADVQTSMIANVLGSDWSDIQAAFEDFGQGTLLDTDPIRQ